MAFYKQPCIHCQTLIDRDSRFCPVCQSASPFGYLCPDCARIIEKSWMLCPGCGRSLITECPHCHQNTFVQNTCEHCGKSLIVKCQNPRCGEMQFFQNKKCTACGKKLLKP